MIEQPCPVCGGNLAYQHVPHRWIHTEGPCSSPTYQRLCDPDPFAPTLGSAVSRAQLRAQTLRQLARTRARGSHRGSPIQALKDDASAG